MSNRGASIRIPWQVAKDGKGYAEDRRPNANCDPYTVTRLILESVSRVDDDPLPGGSHGVPDRLSFFQCTTRQTRR